LLLFGPIMGTSRDSTMPVGTLLSTQQVAGMLGVDVKTVRRYLHSGRLRGSRIGRDYRIGFS